MIIFIGRRYPAYAVVESFRKGGPVCFFKISPWFKYRVNIVNVDVYLNNNWWAWECEKYDRTLLCYQITSFFIVRDESQVRVIVSIPSR